MSDQFSPNWASKTTKNRLLKIEEFAQSYFNSTEFVQCSRENLAKNFGQRQNPLSAYFLDLLLVVTKKYVASLRYNEYHFSWNNLLWSFLQSNLVTEDEVKEVIGEKYLPIQQTVRATESLSVLLFPEEKRAKFFFDLRFFKTQAKSLLDHNAEYTVDEETGRHLSPFQNKPSKVKSIFFAGFWDNDIEACAYTLIHQHLTQVVLPWWGQYDQQFKVMEIAYKHKDKFRQQLSDELGISVKLVKSVLASLMFDPKLVNSPFSGINKLLTSKGVDPNEFHQKAKHCVLLQGLITELRAAWPKLMAYWHNQNGKSARKIYFVEYTNKETGEIHRRFKPASFRARIYFELEKKVMDVVRDEYQGKICHLMHDGFISQDKPDFDSLCSRIKSETGFTVKFSSDRY